MYRVIYTLIKCPFQNHFTLMRGYRAANYSDMVICSNLTVVIHLRRSMHRSTIYMIALILVWNMASHAGQPAVYISPGSTLIGYRTLHRNEHLEKIHTQHTPPYQKLIITATDEPKTWWIQRIMAYPQRSRHAITYQCQEYPDDSELSSTFDHPRIFRITSSTDNYHSSTPILDTKRHHHISARILQHDDVYDYQQLILRTFAAWRQHEQNKTRAPYVFTIVY